MNRFGTKYKSARGAIDSNSANTHLTGSWLIIARIVWLALVVFALSLFIVSIPEYVTHLYSVSSILLRNSWQLSSQSVQALQHAGISIGVYAPFALALSFVTVLVWVVVGAVIFWRKSDDWMALLTAIMLIAWGTGTITGAFYTSNSAWHFAFQWLAFFRNAAYLLFVFLFPNGRFVPGWTRWIAIVAVVEIWAEFVFPASPLNRHNWPPLLSTLAFVMLYVIVAGAQIYRYRRASNTIQREQTKWLVFALTIVILVIVCQVVVVDLLKFPLPDLLKQFIGIVAWYILPVLVPISIGIAILRSRLWDIDILINRTLVYGTLTVLLAMVYVGLVIGLGSLVRLFTGQVSRSPVVIVASTLAIAALFQPMRHRIQAIIDRRFYRRKYDAAKTLEAFSATLRNEVDLNQLRQQLLAVVEETMQPAHVSLWLRKPESKLTQYDRMPPKQLSQSNKEFSHI